MQLPMRQLMYRLVLRSVHPLMLLPISQPNPQPKPQPTQPNPQPKPQPTQATGQNARISTCSLGSTKGIVAGLARAAGITSEESADLSTKRKGFGQDVSKHVEKLALEGANT